MNRILEATSINLNSALPSREDKNSSLGDNISSAYSAPLTEKVPRLDVRSPQTEDTTNSSVDNHSLQASNSNEEPNQYVTYVESIIESTPLTKLTVREFVQPSKIKAKGYEIISISPNAPNHYLEEVNQQRDEYKLSVSKHAADANKPFVQPSYNLH